MTAMCPGWTAAARSKKLSGVSGWKLAARLSRCLESSRDMARTLAEMSRAREPPSSPIGGGLRALARGEHQVRLAGAPLVADAEIERPRSAVVEQRLEPRLIPAREHRDRARVAAVRLQRPGVVLEVGDGDAGVVLQDVRAAAQHELAHAGEAAAVQEIGGALDEAVAGPKRLAEPQEAALGHAVVGEIGAEVIERLLRAAGRGREDDLDRARESPMGGSIERLQGAIRLQVHVAHVADGFAG